MFRFLALALGLSPFVLIELGLRIGGYEGRETIERDPFVRFDAVRPLFEPNGNAGVLAIPPSRQEYFRPEQFQAPKPAGQFRVFCLGGSTVQGRPYATETAFSSWLELRLRAAEPNRSWRVINCGGVSYASYRLAPILNEVLQHEPDLIVLYTGQNEFLEDRTYAAWRERPQWLRMTAAMLEHSRLFRLSQQVAARPVSNEALPTEVDARLDYRGGLEEYHRDDSWHAAIAQHYAANLTRMFDMTAAAGVPVLLCNPVVNLETPPFKSQAETLGDTAHREFETLWDESLAADRPLAERIVILEQAVALSPRNAAAQFHLGQCYQADGRLDAAKACFQKALDEDVCPLRMTSPLDHVLRSIRKPPHVTWCDVRAWFEENSRGGIVGERWLVDHVHPSIHGHQKIAELLMGVMERDGFVSPQPGYADRAEQSVQDRLRQLPTIYFERAKRRLEGLKRWSEGRALKVKS